MTQLTPFNLRSSGPLWIFVSLVTLFLVYYLLRLPYHGLYPVVYDDSETLYHALSLLKGQVPYRHDVSHHFLGYVLPFVIAGKSLGFSADLLWVVSFITQILTAFGVVLILRLFVEWPMALVGGLLCISGREPNVLSFYPQYHFNLLIVFMLYALLLSLKNSAWSLIGALCGGLLLIADQRAAVMATLIPVAIVLGSTRFTLSKNVTALGVCMVPPLLALLYLGFYNALWPFIEQTFIYPTQYRSSSNSWHTFLHNTWEIHKHLLVRTPVHVIAALLGFLTCLTDLQDRRLKLLCFTVLPLALMPLMGGRAFGYYTITWIPYLSIMAVLGADYFSKSISRRSYSIFLLLPVVLSIIQALSYLPSVAPNDYSGDGREEVVNYLRANMKPAESVYVWGYRPDIYVYLERLAPYRFMNQIMIHPDPEIEHAEARSKHIYPRYEREFLTLLTTKPPTYIVTVDRRGSLLLPSPANTAITRMVKESYMEVLAVDKTDLLNVPVSLRVYRRLG